MAPLNFQRQQKNVKSLWHFILSSEPSPDAAGPSPTPQAARFEKSLFLKGVGGDANRSRNSHVWIPPGPRFLCSCHPALPCMEGPSLMLSRSRSKATGNRIPSSPTRSTFARKEESPREGRVFASGHTARLHWRSCPEPFPSRPPSTLFLMLP